MRDAFTRTPLGARFYHGSRRAGGGNLMFLFGDADPPMLMKLYRPRESRLREALSRVRGGIFAATTGVTAVVRCRIERENLELWDRHGFRVPRLFERAAPADVAGVVNWIEYCPGRNLALLLEDDLTEAEVRVELIRRFAAELGERHAAAEESGEIRLIQECATVAHVLVQGDELVTIDLETAYRPGFDLLEAMAREVGGYLMSIAAGVPGPIDQALTAFVSGYPDPQRLRRIADQALADGSGGRWRAWLRVRRSPTASARAELFYALLDEIADGAGRT